MAGPIKIFYCYAPQDKKLRDELEKQLTTLKRLGQITLRLNREIIAGTNWSHVEDRRFQAADLILLLISPDFIHSDYHYGIEMRHALEKHDAGNVWVAPIILRPTALWEKTPIGKLQALPKDGKAITERRNRDAVFVEVVKEISEVVAILLERKQEPEFARNVGEGIFPKFTRVIGPVCITCGARNALGTITCENCGDLLLRTPVVSEIQNPTVSSHQYVPDQEISISRKVLPLGTILDKKFKVVQVLAEGSARTIYKVEQIDTIPPCYYAVKELLLHPNMSKEDRQSAIERFNREIDFLRILKHPRIAALMLPFQENGNYYFAMEFVPGRSLEKILEVSQGPLPEEQTIKWMMQVCEALSCIHSHNPPIILRDVKPSNIMVTPNDDVLLIDFSIARLFDPNKRTNTENLGTISYASPEHLGSITSPGQRRSAQNPGKLVQTDARSDLYSLGATMYHLLTNYEPDPIQTPAPGSILAKNPRLRTIQVGNRVVCPVEQVIIKAIQQDPAQRFQNVETMRVALQSCLPNSAPTPTTVRVPMLSSNSTIIVATNPAPTASTGLVCPKCGFQNRPGGKFCKRDGQPLIQGAVVAPPQQIRARPIQARPVQQQIRARPIQARPVQQPIRARPAQFIQARPVSPGTTIDANSAYRAGLQLLVDKEYAEAITQFQLAASSGGPQYNVLYNLGRAYRQCGESVKDADTKLFIENMKLAAEQFEGAVRLKSDAFDAYFYLGICYRNLGLYSQATTTFKKALALAPQDPAIYYQLGMAATEQGMNHEAEGYFLNGLRIHPEHTLILIALGHLYIETRRIPKAIEILRQAMKHDDTLWEGWYELGRAHMQAKEWRFALSALDRARQVRIDVPDIYSAMATCYLKLNKKVEARRMVNEALLRDPGNAEAIKLQKQL